MSQQEILKHVIVILNNAGIDYMVTGSIASSLQGEPRSTHDIDLVIVLPREAIPKLIAAFPPPDYYLSEESVLDAVRLKSMFNLLCLNDGEKVDFWMLTDEPFDQSRFPRRRVEMVADLTMNVSAPEDTLLAKLRWCKLSGGSEKQFTDALRVYEVQGDRLDIAYLNHWAIQLDVDDLWKRVCSEAEPV